MIVNVVNEKKNNIYTNKTVNSLELKKIKELIDEDNLEYVSPNIKSILNITKEDSPDCFNVLNKKNKLEIDKNIYRVILYIRLSVEDGDLIDGDVSGSIRNQLLFLVDECKKRNWNIVAIFCEEGISGADDNRPEWNKSLKFCECGRTEIVLCKSQSRFSRSMEMIEKYLHNKFVEWNIRFVGLVDSTDTSIKGNKKARQITGLVNEWQVEDQSMNTREILKNKKENGLYAVAWAPYGYKKDPEDKYHLIVDDEAANNVKRIFDLYLEGNGGYKISMIFNKEKIPTPLEYKKMNGSKIGSRVIPKTISYKTEENDTIKKIADKFFIYENEILNNNDFMYDMFECHNDSGKMEESILKKDIILRIPQRVLWTEETVRRIINNEVYTGYLVLGRVQNKSYKDRTKVKVPKDQWIRVPHCHTPLIDRKIWLKINNKREEERKTRKKPQNDGNICELSQIIYCSCCGHVFHKYTKVKKDPEDYYMRCKQVTRTSGVHCDNNKTIKSKEIKNLLKEKINEQIMKYYDLSQVEKDYYEQKVKEDVDKDIRTLEKEKSNIQSCIDKKTNMLNLLYEDRTNGVITVEEFTMLKNKNTIDIEDYKIRINHIEKAIYGLEQKKVIKINNKKLFEKYKEIKEVNREVINEFIDKIYVGQYNQETNTREMEIVWNINVD